jgi:hypothetical protein
MLLSLLLIFGLIKSPDLTVIGVSAANSEVRCHIGRHRPIQKTSWYPIVTQHHQCNNIISQCDLFARMRKKPGRVAKEINAPTLERELL